MENVFLKYSLVKAINEAQDGMSKKHGACVLFNDVKANTINICVYILAGDPHVLISLFVLLFRFVLIIVLIFLILQSYLQFFERSNTNEKKQYIITSPHRCK